MKCLTEVDADRSARQANSDGPAWFCPQINTWCNDKCLCFRKARSSGLFYYEAYCTHQLTQESMYCHVEIEGQQRY